MSLPFRFAHVSCFLATACCTLLCLQATRSTGVEPQRGIEPQRLSDDERAAGFELLFDGRTLDGWQTKEEHHQADWLVDDGAIYCTGQRSEIVFTAKRLPSDFELRFRWHGIRPGLGHRLFLGDTDGTVQFYEQEEYITEVGPEPRASGFGRVDGIWYGAAASDIGVATVAEKLLVPQPESRGQRLLQGMATTDLLHDAGRWNDGAIRTVGSRVECRLNGGKVFEFDVAEPKAGGWYEPDVALDWVAQKKSGFELKIRCDHRPIWVRDLRVCDLTRPAAAQPKPAPQLKQ